MSFRRRRYSKGELLGSLYVDYTMSVFDLGLQPGTNRWEVSNIQARSSTNEVT